MLKAKNLHRGLLAVVLTIIVAMAAVSIATGRVTWNDARAVAVQWSEDALTYNSTVLPCAMQNGVEMGMPAVVVPAAICVVVKGAENIAAATDQIVDVEDLRAAMVAYNYNNPSIGAHNLTEACTFVLKLETGAIADRPDTDWEPTNCVELAGMTPIEHSATIAWMRAHAGVIDDAMSVAADTCDVSWNPNRPISGATECYVLAVVPPARAVLNQTFTINITMSLVLSMILQNFEFKLWYNSTLVNATDAVLGPRLVANYAEVVENLTVPGRVWYGCNLTTPPPLNISDTETLATINFTALGLGTSLLHLNETVLYKLVDTTPAKQDHTTQDADIRVVPPGTPEAIFTYSPEWPIVGENVTFNASLSTPDGGFITSYYWDFDDGANGTDMILNHTYTTFGNYNVTLTVTDNETLTDTTWDIVTVRDYPVATFTYSPAAPIVNEIATFNASLSTPDGGTITSYFWDFDDGANGTDMILNHTYTTPGNYTVVLNVTDSEGLWDTESKSITVAAAPEAEFPWLWVVVVVVVVVVAVAVAVVVRRRGK